MIWFAVIFIAILLAAMLAPEEECPRDLMGYKCKGGKCDHSFEELMKARGEA